MAILLVRDGETGASNPGPGAPDGIKLDVAGNLYSAGSGGIYVFSSAPRSSGALCTSSGNHKYRLRRR